jgi:hypothetical protein
MAWHKADECSRRLAKIPGVGPFGAALLMMKKPRRPVLQSGQQQHLHCIETVDTARLKGANPFQTILDTLV